jgi:hypothetical protein
MSTKAHLGFEGAFPFGQPSDNLRTTFGHFLACSKWYLAPGRAGVRKRLGEHMGVGVGVWGLGVGFWGLGFQIALEIILRTVFAQNAAESEAVGSSD